MVVKAVVQGADVRAAIADIKSVDSKLFTQLKRDIKKDVDGVANSLLAKFPQEGELSGLNFRGRTSYQKPPKAVSAFTPGFARSGRVSSLLSIKLKMPETVGAWISEMAGMRGIARIGGQSRTYRGPLGEMKSHRLNGQGAYLIDRLDRRTAMKGRGGRYGWAYFVSKKDELHRKGIEIMNNAIDKFNRGAL